MTVRLTLPPRSRQLPRLDSRLLRSRAVRALREVGHSTSELSIAIVMDDEIAALNSEHRGKRSATDVLSFSLLEGEYSDQRGKLLGDVVIGIETAARQARAAHRGLDEEVARRLIHGILHLRGWDHEETAEAKLMRGEERRLWRAVRS
ncbi:MAG: rRNA maturation RNase YbeY [Deltaproteobacteria bacterium]|nr:rRNA maturation RNase YbeY [Deltaproteobacteria bacterium]